MRKAVVAGTEGIVVAVSTSLLVNTCLVYVVVVVVEVVVSMMRREAVSLS